jgi:hypothetical protein
LVFAGVHPVAAKTLVEEILMELEDLKRDSARLTRLIEEALAGRQHLDATIKREYARQYIDLKIATARIEADVERARHRHRQGAGGEMTDAEQRNKWCEQMKARVYWLPDGKWWVDWSDQWLRTVSDPDRNTAIDKARGVK